MMEVAQIMPVLTPRARLDKLALLELTDYPMLMVPMPHAPTLLLSAPTLTGLRTTPTARALVAQLGQTMMEVARIMPVLTPRARLDKLALLELTDYPMLMVPMPHAPTLLLSATVRTPP